MAIAGTRNRGGGVTPHLLVRGAAEASAFYQRAFGAQELYRSSLPGGEGLHIEMRIAGTLVLLTDEMRPSGDDPGHMMAGVGSPQTLCGTSVVIDLCVDDADAMYERAVGAGAKATLPMADTFWGDRYGWVTDPFGHVWAILSVMEELTPEQVAERMASYVDECGAGTNTGH